MPEVKPNETESEFVSRCIPVLISEGKTQEQAAGACYGIFRNAKKDIITKSIGIINEDIKRLTEINMIKKYADEIETVMKARTVDGFESPEPGDLSGEGSKLLAKVYAKCRKDGGDKEKCSKIAWSAVNNAGYKSDDKDKVIKKAEALIKNLDAEIKKAEMQQIEEGRTEPTKTHFGSLTAQAFLMAFPYNLDNAEPNNPWMKGKALRPINYDLAYSQWLDLKDVVSPGNLVYVLPSQHDAQDEVYVANIGIMLPQHIRRDMIILSNFRSDPRDIEEGVGRGFFNLMEFNVVQPPFFFEGFADLKFLKDNIFIGGYGIRTQAETFDWMEREFQIQVIKVRMKDELCYDDKTEILTDQGWKYFKDLNRTEKVATYNPGTTEMVFQKPNKYQAFEYCGKMYHMKSKYTDLMVTEDHEIYCNDSVWKDDFKLVEINEMMRNNKSRQIKIKNAIGTYKIKEDVDFFYLPPLKTKHIEHSKWHDKLISTKKDKINLPINEIICRYENFETPNEIATDYNVSGNTIIKVLLKNGTKLITGKRDQYKPMKFKMDDWIQFMGWYLTEGYYTKPKVGYVIGICQQKKENREKIKKLIERMGLKFSENESGFVSNNKRLYDYLKQFGRSKDKYIPEYLKNISSSQNKVLFDVIIAGDGNARKIGQWRNSGFSFYSKSKQFIDDVQELSFKLGYRSQYNKVKRKSIETEQYVLNINDKRKESWVYKKDVSVIDLKEPTMVYDVTVPEYHILVVRRNGKICLSGNCYHFDTELFCLDSESVMCVTEAMDESDVKAIEKVAGIIDVPMKFGYQGTTNSLRVGDKILNASSISSISKEDEIYDTEKARVEWFNNITTKLDLIPVLVNLSEFDKSGASLSCLILPLSTGWRT